MVIKAEHRFRPQEKALKSVRLKLTDRLVVFEMWCYKKMMTINWVNAVSSKWDQMYN